MTDGNKLEIPTASVPFWPRRRRINGAGWAMWRKDVFRRCLSVCHQSKMVVGMLTVSLTDDEITLLSTSSARVVTRHAAKE